jgi:indole-3-glycerol phosphate synthase
MAPNTEKNLLERIVASVRKELQARKHRIPEKDLMRDCRNPALAPTRGFNRALREDGVRIIAEVKRASPSKGIFPFKRSPAEQAIEYAEAGAACISVVTEPDFFRGSLQMLAEIRAAVEVPLLRKDFIVEPYQIYEARLAGADAILLIVAALDDAQLSCLLSTAADLDLDALVEVTSAMELHRALQAGARVVGVNNRDLRDFSTDIRRSLQLASEIPPDITAVSESGIQDPGQIEQLRKAGYRGFLVGEHLMRQDAPGEALRRLIRRGSPGSALCV